MHILIGLAVAIALGGGVSLAAESSQPGDTLYTVKTHVNDEVRAFVDANIETSAEKENEVKTDTRVKATTTLDASLNAAGGTYLDTDVQAGLEVGADALVR